MRDHPALTHWVASWSYRYPPPAYDFPPVAYLKPATLPALYP